MNKLDFINEFRNIPVFSTTEIEKVFPDFERENLLNWQKKGVLLRIRNGWYSLTNEIQSLEHLYYVSNKIYSPSYISLQSAFAHYGWIPEGVFTITAVSTLKTKAFDTPKGRFSYSNIQAPLFWGYKILNVDGRGVKMAEPEKALLDFIYFHPKIQQHTDYESFRFNLPRMKADLDVAKLAEYARFIGSPALTKRLILFNQLLEHVESF
jgi:predicted transcriptional regulator of viral defense system